MRDSTVENTGPESLQPDHQYVWSQRYIDAPVLRDKNTDSDGLCDDGRLYYLCDANFNVTRRVGQAVPETGRDAVERYLYDPYGVATIYTGDWSSTRSTSSYNTVYRYTGRVYHPNTGLYHYRHRSYHATLGRFLTRDPMGYVDGGGLYAYTGSNPTSRADPLGQKFMGCDPPGAFTRVRWQKEAAVGEATCAYTEILRAPRTCYVCWIPFSWPVEKAGAHLMCYITPPTVGCPTYAAAFNLGAGIDANEGECP